MSGKNIAIILAAGSGNRFGSTLPKQYLEVCGKMIIEHTIDVFESHEGIDEIALVVQKEYYALVNHLISRNHHSKVKKVIFGGSARHLSSMSAISAYTTDEDNLLFHDAVRPLVSKRIIDDCLKALEHHEAVNVAIRTTDTIIQVDEANRMIGCLVRSSLRNGQTPQCFKRGVIAKAYSLAIKDKDFGTTDDCGVVLKYLPQTAIYVVEGEEANFKVTYQLDLEIANKLFQKRLLDRSF